MYVPVIVTYISNSTHFLKFISLFSYNELWPSKSTAQYRSSSCYLILLSLSLFLSLSPSLSLSLSPSLSLSLSLPLPPSLSLPLSSVYTQPLTNQTNERMSLFFNPLQRNLSSTLVRGEIAIERDQLAMCVYELLCVGYTHYVNY